ncbi:hypothetical protein [Cochleicola gelatinilyticus]|uniref:Uncharacterized protein n=1 Tax=Cochleicola gelatinilyticus TaxID=1763537 RepID=A0A167HL50_9FLAO|nr:hypothetical protein [Cochleicola gelatinilyticus]OAB78728.1 hypothetical protein ULVI_09100 [Cochleicola gelatinilyticus]
MISKNINLIEKIENLILELSNLSMHEYLMKVNGFTHLQIALTIKMLEKMKLNIGENNEYDISQEIEKILRWSADSWNWEFVLTKKTWEVIELYKKNNSPNMLLN